jgi:hypothetical protein
MKYISWFSFSLLFSFIFFLVSKFVKVHKYAQDTKGEEEQREL